MTEKINGRTPEEIKKGLECCMFDDEGMRNCDECPYINDGCIYDKLNKDALAYIQQLERERDAAVKDMTELMHLGKFCRHCKHITDDGECTHDFDDTNGLLWNCWQWRGVEVE